MEGARNQGGRFSSRRKVEAVLRLLRGEGLDRLSRELGATAAMVVGWREAFMAGGQPELKSRRAGSGEDDLRRLRAKVGELMLDKGALDAEESAGVAEVEERDTVFPDLGPDWLAEVESPARE